MAGDQGPVCIHWGRVGKMCLQCGMDVVARKATDERFVLEAMVLLSILILNVIDAMLTLAGIQRGILLEVNPLLAPLVDVPIALLVVKFGLVIAGTVALWRLKSHRWVLPASLFLFWVYCAIILYHLRGILDLCVGGS